jgi:signal transduction histidine kinase
MKTRPAARGAQDGAAAPRDDGAVPAPHELRHPARVASRRQSGWPVWLQVVFEAAIVVFAIVALFAYHTAGPHERKLAVLALLGATLALCVLVVRGSHPRGVFAAVCVLSVLNPNPAATTLPLLAATFNVALRCSRRDVALAAVAAAAVLLGGVAWHTSLPLTLGDFLSRLAAIGLAIAAGLYLAARRAYVESLHDRATQLERERLLLAEQAVAAERVRIARELHDVVAHGVSLMVVQAQALGALDGAARDAAGAQIATIGREALTEMHRMLDVLRLGIDEAPELEPAPGVRDVASLVERARGAGIDVALEVEGEPRPLPAGVDLSAYRIVQEALTNVVKHARALRTDVRVRYCADALELWVIDDGINAAAAAAPPGHGLLGMRERVALFGGTLESGARPDGEGYAVRAVLPL